jgi:hypothetical protein
MSFDTDAGVVTWIDMPVTSAAIGTVQSYRANLDGEPVLSIYGVSDGGGNLNTRRVGVGTTTPFGTFSVGTATSSFQGVNFVIGSSTRTDMIVYGDGRVGFGTSSPSRVYSVNVAGNLYVATTTATSTIAGGLNISGGGLKLSTIISCSEALETDSSGNVICGTDATGGGGGAVAKWSTSTDNISIYANSAQKVGIGTSSPFSILTVQATSSLSNINLFQVVGARTAGATSTMFVIDSIGDVGIGTSSPYAMLSVAGQVVANNFFATSTTATSTFAGGLTGTGLTVLDNLEVGALQFDTDAGSVSWVDLPVISAATGTIQSINAQIDSQTIFSIYAIATSSMGGLTQTITKTRAVVGTTTSGVLDSNNIPFGSLIIGNGALCVDNGTGNTCATSARTRGFVYAEGNSVSGLDLAEMYPMAETVEAGDLLMLSSTEPKAVRKYNASLSTTTPAIFGIVSTDPGVTLGGFSDESLSTSTPVALTGRVPLKVTLENGPIAIGDRIAASVTQPGYGAKAIKSGETIGIALEPFDLNSQGNKVLVFVDKRYHFAPDQFAIDAETGDLSFALASTTFIGIGTTTPQYKVHVIGDVGAQSFVNISTEAAKTDITYLEETDKATILDEIRGARIAQYRYKAEDANNPLRIGLIAEEAPLEVLSVDGKGVDIYKLSTFILAGLQETDRRVTDLETRVAAVEAILASGGFNVGSISTGVSMESVLSGLSTLGTRIVANIASFTNLFADELTVGTEEKPAGITLYDEATGDPYCVKVVNGAVTTGAGKCSDVVDTTKINNTSTTTPSGDTTAPTIQINGLNPADIEKGTAYGDLGATVTSAGDENLGIKAVVDGVDVGDISNVTIDTSTVGTHTIEYYAVDQAGNRGSVTRTVNVIEIGGGMTTPIDTLPEPTPDPIITDTGSTTPSN